MYVKLVFLCLIFLMVFGSIAVCASGDPASRPGTTVYRLGAAEIIAVRDQISERNRDLLIGDAKRIVELMPEPTTAGSVNTYVVRTQESIVLIDAGWGFPRGETLENLKQIGITPDKVDAVLFTHLHGDHVSGLVSEGKTVFPKAKIYVSDREYVYWFSDSEMNQSANKANFILARHNLQAYGGRIRTFKAGTEIMPGITAIDEAGHTSGHVGYLVKNNNRSMLIWGDLTHFTEVQMAAPEIAVRYDIDPKQAVAARQAILAWVSRENIPVAGMHVLYPGVGRVRALGNQSYVFDPLDKLD